MNMLLCSLAALSLHAMLGQPTPGPTATVVTNAGQVPQASAEETILIEMSIYQFKVPPGGTAEAPAAQGEASKAPEVADPADGEAPINVLPLDGMVRLFGKTMRLDSPDLDASRISAPRLLCRSGEPASIMIGRELEYLEPAGEKLFRAVGGPELFEGLKVDVTAALKDGVIRVERMNVRLSECIDRQKLDGLDLPVGKPRMRTCEVSTQFDIEPGQRGLIPIRTHGQQENPDRLLVVVRLERVAAQPAAAPGK